MARLQFLVQGRPKVESESQRTGGRDGRNFAELTSSSSRRSREEEEEEGALSNFGPGLVHYTYIEDKSKFEVVQQQQQPSLRRDLYLLIPPPRVSLLLEREREREREREKGKDGQKGGSREAHTQKREQQSGSKSSQSGARRERSQ